MVYSRESRCVTALSLSLSFSLPPSLPPSLSLSRALSLRSSSPSRRSVFTKATVDRSFISPSSIRINSSPVSPQLLHQEGDGREIVRDRRAARRGQLCGGEARDRQEGQRAGGHLTRLSFPICHAPFFPYITGTFFLKKKRHRRCFFSHSPISPICHRHFFGGGVFFSHSPTSPICHTPILPTSISHRHLLTNSLTLFLLLQVAIKIIDKSKVKKTIFCLSLPKCRTPTFAICQKSNSKKSPKYVFAHPPISPICRTPLFPYLTF